jgi:hypothetical protein
LRAEGCNVLERYDASEQGKFGYVLDPEGGLVDCGTGARDDEFLAFERDEACSVACGSTARCIERFESRRAAMPNSRCRGRTRCWPRRASRSLDSTRSPWCAALGVHRRAPGDRGGAGLALALDRPSCRCPRSPRSLAGRTHRACSPRSMRAWARCMRRVSLRKAAIARLLDAERVAAPDRVVLPDDACGSASARASAPSTDAAAHARARFMRIDANALPHAADVARLAVHAFHAAKVSRRNARNPPTCATTSRSPRRTTSRTRRAR